tara:strand:- start:58 stop:396 length:339 start_codon:yes stop_codon:yes gene_type:complete
MQSSKINWTQLAKIAPNNPATGKDYKGQSLKRVAEGLRQNVMIWKWLQGNGISCAKTKEGKFRAGRQKPRPQTRTEVSPLCDEQKSQLSEITKAIRGETYSYPTDHNSSEGS